MNRIVSKILWTISIALPLLLAGSWLLAKKVRQTLIDELNNQLQVRVEMYSLDISLWSNFPNIGLRAVGLQVKESTPFYGLNAIDADEVKLVFNIWDVISQGAVIDKVIVKGAHLRLFSGKGVTNYNFFKPAGDTSAVNFELKKIKILQSSVWYVDNVNNHSLNFDSKKLEASGKLYKEKYALKLKGDALFDHLLLNGSILFKGKHFYTDSDIEVNDKIGSYHFNKCKLQLGLLKSSVKGDMLLNSSGPDLDIHFTGENLTLNSLISFLPGKLFKNTETKSEGTLSLNGRIKGKFAENSLPLIEVSMKGEGLAYTSADAPLPIKNLSFTGSFIRNTTTPEGKLQANITQVMIGSGNVSAKIEAEGTTNIRMKSDLKGKIDLADFEKLIENPYIHQLKGTALFNGKIDLLINRNSEKNVVSIERADGDFKLSNGYAMFKQDSTLVKGVQADISVRNNALQIHALYAQWKGNDALLKGSWETFLPWLQDSTKTLAFKGELVAQQLDLNNALPALSANKDNGNESVNTDISVNLVVNHMVWKKHVVDHFRGNLEMLNEDIALNALSFKTMDGEINADLVLQKQSDSLTNLRLKLKTNHVNVKTLFERFNNFEQSEITAANLEGFVNADVVYEHVFNASGDVDLNTVKALGVLQISKGRLKNYEPLKALSKFIDVKDLMDVKFSDLSNTIEIASNTISIPHMKIENNALNLELSGTHTFQNYMDYNIKVFLSDVLSAKYDFVKRKKEKKAEQQKGGVAAYIHMYGTPENLKLEYDKKTVAKKISQDVKNERKQFFEQVKSDFKGLNKPVEPEKKENDANIWDE